MKNLFSPAPLWQQPGLAFIRIIVGIFMIYHGWEVFDPAKMRDYATWDIFKNSSSALFMVYMGKIAELVSGIMLTIGCFTRLGSLILTVTMLYISFFVGNGKIWYDAQYPFLFVLLGLVFFFSGPGKWSIDNLLFNKGK
jgi:putative oxidoreductase